MEVAMMLIAALAILWAILKYMGRHAANIPDIEGFTAIRCLWAFVTMKSLDDIQRFVAETGKRVKKGIGKFWMGSKLVVFINDPKYVEVIAKSPHCVHKGELFPIFTRNKTGVLSTNDTHKWKALKKPLIKAISKKAIETDFHLAFLEKNRAFIRYIRNVKCGVDCDILKEIGRVLTDIFSVTQLGVETNEIEEGNYRFLEYFSQYIDSVWKNQTKEFTFWRPRFLRPLNSNSKEYRLYLDWALKERMNKISSGEDKRDERYYTDFLLRRKEEENLSFRDISTELGEVTLAFTDTESNVVSNAIQFLAMYPHIQEAAYQEQLSIFGENLLLDPTPDTLNSMEYLTRIIKEANRFTSPTIIFKNTTSVVKLDKYTIPKGVHIFIIMENLHHDERYWEKPTTFHPDHFLPEEEAKRPSFAYIPFGIGPRSCPGSQLAMNSMKVILSFLIRNFRISSDMKPENVIIKRGMMRYITDNYVKFEDRNKCCSST